MDESKKEVDGMSVVDGSGDRKYFTIIPNYVLNHSTHWDREVYSQMKKIAGEFGTCWSSQKTLAKQCGMSINRLKKSIKYLIERKWIILVGQKTLKTEGGLQEVNEYKISDLWKLNVEFYENNQGISPEDTPSKVYHESGQGISRVRPKVYHQKTTNKNPISKDIIRTYNNNSEQDSQNINLFINSFKEVNPSYKKFFSNKSQRAAVSRLMELHSLEVLLKISSLLPRTNGMAYFPIITTPIQLEDKFASLESALRKKKASLPTVAKIR